MTAFGVLLLIGGFAAVVYLVIRPGRPGDERLAPSEPYSLDEIGPDPTAQLSADDVRRIVEGPGGDR